jgi:hypothetical protein
VGNEPMTRLQCGATGRVSLLSLTLTLTLKPNSSITIGNRAERADRACRVGVGVMELKKTNPDQGEEAWRD